MSDFEPTEPYVYQPEGAYSPLYPRIYGIGGPGAEHLRKQRFTKVEAEEALAALLVETRAAAKTRADKIRGATLEKLRAAKLVALEAYAEVYDYPLELLSEGGGGQIQGQQPRRGRPDKSKHWWRRYR